MKQLRAYQETAWRRFKDAMFFCLNFACGLGKTIALIAIAQYKNRPTLIIAPKSLCTQWYDELIEQGVSPEDIFVASATEEHKNIEAYAAKFDAWLKRGDNGN